MSLTIYNTTPVSPTSSSSEAYVAYADLGPRPVCTSCDSIDECPECASDLAYKIPVVAGDLLYTQFRQTDNYNERPTSPEFGWRNGADEFYISASIEWSSGEILALDEQDIIAGKEVGWYDGSYQNLILNSQKISDYMLLNNITDICFRILINVYTYEREAYIVADSIQGSLPPVPPAKDNVYVLLTDGTVWYTSNGAWVEYTGPVTIFFVGKQRNFYEYEVSQWVVTEPEKTKVLESQCYTAWYQFVNCEQTVIVEGQHGISDCRGNYYGGTIQFRDRYRVWASLELVTFSKEETKNENDEILHSKQYEGWLFRIMRGLPELIARRLANSLFGLHTFLDNNEYINISDVDRNNESGLSWWSSITAQRLLCEINIGCTDEIFTNPIVICEVPDCPEVGDPARVHNSDDTYDVNVACGGTLLLADYNYEVFIDGVSSATGSYPAMVDITLNITIT